jgi:light-regulated signal transduction histidine kinase (bacteriophytochrome)
MQSQQALEELNSSLEKRVAERTADVMASNRELEAFTYTVSHDLRAPLRAIDGFTQIMIEDYEPQFDEEGKKICSMIRENAQRMGRLIEDLLAFSRISRSAIATTSINMYSTALSVFQEITTNKKIDHIDFSIEPIPPIPGDLPMLRQVWFNLFDNALKFSSRTSNPAISVTYRIEGNMIVYCVKDNGAGFDMQYADKLFSVFQRLHSTKEYEGTGVGLAIVQRIIHKHGGRVWASSQIDEGASVYFSLPMEHPEIKPI